MLCGKSVPTELLRKARRVQDARLHPGDEDELRNLRAEVCEISFKGPLTGVSKQVITGAAQIEHPITYFFTTIK